MRMQSEDIKRVIHRYHARLTSHRDALDGMNVYPVPDGDTGTNMALTMGAVVEAVGPATRMGEVADRIAHGSLMGARGNSGVILSQILRGICEVIGRTDGVGALELAEGLERASQTAYQAVQRPVEGTILTVLRESAEAARSAAGSGETGLTEVLRTVFDSAVASLERTPELLPVLKEAGVVDAGAAGYLLLIAALLDVAGGSDVEVPVAALTAGADAPARELRQGPAAATGRWVGPRYEVMFLLRADDVDELRARWEAIGESIVVVGGDGMWNCHIHTDLVGPAIEAGVEAGTPSRIRVTDLREEAGDPGVHDAPFPVRPDALAASVGVVAVVVGEGLVDVFAGLGAQAVVAGGQTMNPSTEDLLAAVESVPAQQVVILPNNKNIVPVAEHLDTLTTKAVAVVPTRSVAQGIAAMVGYNPAGTDLLEATEDMAAAASAVVTGEVTQAVRDATVEFGSIAKGDWVGVADGTIVIADADQETALRGLVAAILPPESELLTLYTGNQARASAVKALEAWLGELHPGLEVVTVRGGQPLYPYFVSIE